jgi:crossover junction endodeoxyribonuclease RuvC
MNDKELVVVNTMQSTNIKTYLKRTRSFKKDQTNNNTTSLYRILSIDPGTFVTGWSILDPNNNTGMGVNLIDCGTIKASNHLSRSERLLRMANGITKIINQYSPHDVAIEEAFLGKSPKTTLALGEVRGVLMMEAERYGCKVYEYATSLCKQYITGKGNAKKDVVATMIRAQFNNSLLNNSVFDTTDAIAVGVTHFLITKSALLTRSRLSKQRGSK